MRVVFSVARNGKGVPAAWAVGSGRPVAPVWVFFFVLCVVIGAFICPGADGAPPRSEPAATVRSAAVSDEAPALPRRGGLLTGKTDFRRRMNDRRSRSLRSGYSGPKHAPNQGVQQPNPDEGSGSLCQGAPRIFEPAATKQASFTQQEERAVDVHSASALDDSGGEEDPSLVFSAPALFGRRRRRKAVQVLAGRRQEPQARRTHQVLRSLAATGLRLGGDEAPFRLLPTGPLGPPEAPSRRPLLVPLRRPKSLVQLAHQREGAPPGSFEDVCEDRRAEALRDVERHHQDLVDVVTQLTSAEQSILADADREEHILVELEELNTEVERRLGECERARLSQEEKLKGFVDEYKRLGNIMVPVDGEGKNLSLILMTDGERVGSRRRPSPSGRAPTRVPSHDRAAASPRPGLSLLSLGEQGELGSRRTARGFGHLGAEDDEMGSLALSKTRSLLAEAISSGSSFSFLDCEGRSEKQPAREIPQGSQKEPAREMPRDMPLGGGRRVDPGGSKRQQQGSSGGQQAQAVTGTGSPGVDRDCERKAATAKQAFALAQSSLRELVDKSSELAVDSSCFLAAQEYGNVVRAEKMQSLGEVRGRISKARGRLRSMGSDLQELALWDASLGQVHWPLQVADTCAQSGQWLAYREKAKQLLDVELIGSSVAESYENDFRGVYDVHPFARGASTPAPNSELFLPSSSL